MNLNKVLLTNNECYKIGKTIKVKGIMVHSTGANNPKLSRYVAPDDGKLGTPSSSHWNQKRPGGRQVCVHAFIGKLKDGSIATYQTLPWNMRGWHAGGSANNNYIGFEICEDNLQDRDYFNKVYKEAAELCAYLCKMFKLDPLTNIICHSEGYTKGIASNHGDVMHWFPKHGKSMKTFRLYVKELLEDNKDIKESTDTSAKDQVYRVGASGKKYTYNTVSGNLIVTYKDGTNKIYYKGKTPGYEVAIDTYKEDTSQKGYLVKVTADELNIRNKPNVNGTIISKVKKDDVFTVSEVSNGWGKPKWYYDNKKEGWLNLKYTTKV